MERDARTSPLPDAAATGATIGVSSAADCSSGRQGRELTRLRPDTMHAAGRAVTRVGPSHRPEEFWRGLPRSHLLWDAVGMSTVGLPGPDEPLLERDGESPGCLAPALGCARRPGAAAAGGTGGNRQIDADRARRSIGNGSGVSRPANVAICEPAPLSAGAVSELVRRRVPAADAQLCRRCFELTGGSPSGTRARVGDRAHRRRRGRRSRRRHRAGRPLVVAAGAATPRVGRQARSSVARRRCRCLSPRQQPSHAAERASSTHERSPTLEQPYGEPGGQRRRARRSAVRSGSPRR